MRPRIGGLCAATASVLALNRRDGRKQGCHVDISEIESLALLPQTPLVLSTLGLPAKSRSKADGGKTSLLAVLPCKDGYVGIKCKSRHENGQSYVAGRSKVNKRWH